MHVMHDLFQIMHDTCKENTYYEDIEISKASYTGKYKTT